jgi:hypothetical protein
VRSSLAESTPCAQAVRETQATVPAMTARERRRRRVRSGEVEELPRSRKCRMGPRWSKIRAGGVCRRNWR